MGGLPGAKTWQQYKFGFGPSLDGLFKQSNYGVVTKMGFWLFPEPEAYFSGTVMPPRHDDIVKIVEIFNYLENTMAVHGLPSMYSAAYPMTPISDPELEALHAAAGGPDPARSSSRAGARPAMAPARGTRGPRRWRPCTTAIHRRRSRSARTSRWRAGSRARARRRKPPP